MTCGEGDWVTRSFELNTTISNLRDLKASDLSPYDAIYLGNITCRLYEANLLEHLDDLQEAIAAPFRVSKARRAT